jgi:hypothetical protein
MYVAAFVALLRRLWPAISVRSQSGGAILSHDVDHPGSVFRWHGVERIRVLAGDGIRRRDPGLLIRRAASFLPSRRGIGPLDPFDTFSFLMSASEAVGTRSIFFFMTDETEIPDGSAYRVDRPWAARLIREIAAREHSVGLHGSYRSFVDPDRLRAEWARLEGARPGLQPKVIRRTIRQHFLRFRAGATWRAQASAGFVEDHSLGFADAIGYRAGTARKFPAYDIERGESLPLQVRPLHVMDVALLQRTTGPLSERLRRVADMGARTRRYGGELSLLWHNSSLETNAAKAQYLSLVRELFGS